MHPAPVVPPFRAGSGQRSGAPASATLAPVAAVADAGGETLLGLLRHATRDAHDRLEAMLALTDPALDLARYRAVLARFLGFWLAWEPAVGAALGEPDFLAPRRRADLLGRDLRALGMSEAELAALPGCPPPTLPPGEAALGSLYVLEGSTLGGRVLVRHVADTLGLAEGAPGSLYFSGYGAATGRMWMEFRARLRAVPASAHQEAARAAATTFALLEHGLGPAGRGAGRGRA